MSTNPYPDLPPCPCGVEGCPKTASEASAWHQQQAIRLMHSIKQAVANGNFVSAVLLAETLGRHRAGTPLSLVPHMEEALAVIPREYLDPQQAD